MLCCLCLLENPHLMDIFDDLGEELNIVEIVTEHFWFKPDQHDTLASQICTACWNKIDNFHKFYKHVEKAHQEFQQKKVSFKKEDKISLSAIKEEISYDEKYFENNLEQLEMEIVDSVNQYEKREVNPLWYGQYESDCSNESDFKFDTSEECEPNVTIQNNFHNNVEILTNLENTKQKAYKNFHGKKRKLRNSSEDVKKHIHMVCDLCDFVGNTFGDIKEHFKEYHPAIKPYINCCNKKFYKNDVIANHAARHENPDCFRSATSLIRAYLSDRGQFVSSSNASSDILPIKSCVPQGCDDCNRSFTTPKGLQTHNIEFHEPEEKKMHSCELCLRKFGRKNLLEIHRQSHIPKEQWSFICTKCSTSTFKFASQYLLNIHVSMFHNRKINFCHVCSKEIKDKKAFEKHVLLHFEDGGPRIKCPIVTCHSWFKDEDSVKYHIQRYHKTFKWSECRKALSSHNQKFQQIDYDKSNENLIALTNKFEEEQNNFVFDDKFDIECDISDQDEVSVVKENDLCLDEELLIDVKSDNSINHFEDQEISKCTSFMKTKKKEDSAKKTRTSHRLDPKVSDESIKKHINMTCDLCVFVGKSFPDIKDHFKDYHPNERAYIMCCNRKFDRLYVIAQHAARHENPDCFRCNECNRSFTTPYGLRTHNIEHHAPDEEKMHACEYCPRKFQRKNLLEHHRSTHIPKEQWTFNCTKCITRSSIFASQYLLNIHNSMFHRKEGNICHVCAKVIKDKKAFEKHVRYHFEDSGPRLKCPLPDCNRWLKDEDNLKTHIQLHNLAGKTYKCPECDKECPNRRALSGHIRFVHSKDIFRCEACDKTFKKALGLKEHMAQHTGESLYKCPFCDKTFNSNANMHSHKKKKHPIEWEQLRRKKIGPVPS